MTPETDATTNLNPRLTDGVNPIGLDWSALSLDQVPVPTDQKYTAAEIEGLVKRGIELHTKGRTKEAMEIYREVLLHDRTNKKALYFASIALSQENAPEDQVLAIMEHSVKEVGNVPEAQYNLGILLHRMGKEEDARRRFHAAIEMMPELIEAKTSLGGAYLNLGNKDEGLYWLRQAAGTHAASADSIYSRGFAHLTLGNLYQGWTDYDKRWLTASFLVENRRDFGKARHWNGKPIPGKNLYVHTEQGAGDIVMLSRFLKRVKAKSQCAILVLEVGEALIELMAQVEGVDYVIASNTPIPAAVDRIHFYLPFMGIPRQVGLFNYDKVTDAAGWLHPVAGSTIELPLTGHVKENPLKVGISWAGSKAHKNDRYRSILWPQFRDEIVKPLRDRVQFYSFQVGDRARDMDDGGEGVCDLTPLLKTFADTASAANQMDVMLCVDTSTVHVAGALVDGPEILMLTPAAPDWRWLLDRADTPWYRRVQLIRQDRCDDWATPLAKAAEMIVARTTAEAWS